MLCSQPYVSTYKRMTEAWNKSEGVGTASRVRPGMTARSPVGMSSLRKPHKIHFRIQCSALEQMIRQVLRTPRGQQYAT